MLDQDGGHDPLKDRDATKLSITRHSDSSAHLKGQLGTADAEIVLPSLEAAAQNLRRDSQTDVNANEACCDTPPTSTMYHHIKHWNRDHGPTADHNLLYLCPRHHGIIHRNNWTAQLAPDATATFTTPNGTELTTKPVTPKPRPGPVTTGPRRAT